MLIAHLKSPVKQTWLLLANHPRESDGRHNIRQCLMRAQVFDLVDFAEVFKLETWLARFMFRPLHSLRAKCVAHPRQVNQVPAGVIVLVLALVGVKKIPVKQVAAEFVVKMDAVVARCAGTGFHHFRVNFCSKLSFNKSLFQCFLRRYAGNQAGNGVRQNIPGRLAIPVEGVTHRLKRGIGP